MILLFNCIANYCIDECIMNFNKRTSKYKQIYKDCMQQSDPAKIINQLTNPREVTNSLKQLSTIIRSNKNLIYPHLKNLLALLENLIARHQNRISVQATQFLILFINSFSSQEDEQYLKTTLLNQIVTNLGHPSQASLRQASHLFLLQYVQIYKNFDSLLFHYLDAGLKQNIDWHIQQKVINSFQSIFILQSKLVKWNSQYLVKISETLLQRFKHYNQSVSKASVQALSAICKSKDVKELFEQFSDDILEQLKKFITQKIANYEIDILAQIDKIIFQREHPNIVENPQNSQVIEAPKHNFSIQELQSAPIQLLFQALLHSPNSILIRYHAFQVISQKHLQTEQFSVQLGLNHLKIFDLLKEEPIKMISIGLRLIELYYELDRPDNKSLLRMMGILVHRLSDSKAAIRQLIFQTIRIFIEKGEKQQWMDVLLQSLQQSNQFQKQQILGLLSCIFKDKTKLPKLEDSKFQDILVQLSQYVEQNKTRIKLRTFECMIEICLGYRKVIQGSKLLQTILTPIYYQIFIQRLNKAKKENLQPIFQTLKLSELKQLRPLMKKQKSQSLTRRQTPNALPLRKTLEMRFNRTSQKQIAENGRRSINTIRKQHTEKQRFSRKMSQIFNKNKVQNRTVQLPSLTKVKSFEQQMKSSRSYGMNNSTSRLSISKESSFKSDAYIQRQNLLSLSQPQKTLKTLIVNFQAEDWSKQFEAINNLRQINEHHSSVIMNAPSTIMNILVQNVLKCIESQRSTVAKNGLICLTQLLEKLSKILDPYVQIIVDKLTKKSSDANVFVNFEVRKCSNTAAVYLTQSKILAQIQQLKHSKSIPIKQSLIQMLHAIVNKPSNIKDVDKVSQLLVYFSDEAFNQLRTKSRLAINDLCQRVPGHNNKLKSTMTSQGYQRLSSVDRSLSVEPSMRNTATSNKGNTTTGNFKSKISKNTRYTKESFDLKIEKQANSKLEQQKQQKVIQFQPKKIKRKIIKVSSFPSEFNELQDLLINCKDSDWRKRIQNLEKTAKLAHTFHLQFPQHRLSSQFVDVLTQQIGEHNNKVSLNALQILKALISPLRPLIQNNLSMICNRVFNCLGSHKPQQKSISEQIFQTMISQIDLSLILQHWCFGCLFSLPKSKQYLIVHLMRSLKKIKELNRQALVKHVMPMVDKLLDDKKPQVVYYTGELVKQLHLSLGEQIYGYVNKKVELGKYLKSK